MWMYFRDDIERVRRGSSILALSLALSPSINIKPASGKFYRLCIFHNERTPSMVLHEDTSSYHCYGCGEGGDIFKYLMEWDGITFRDSVATLAKAFNIELEGKANERKEIIGEVLKTLGSSHYKELVATSNAKLSAKIEFERINKPKTLEILPKFILNKDDNLPF